MFAHRTSILGALLLCLPQAAGALPSVPAGPAISITRCGLLNLKLPPGHTVNWIGECRDGLAEGPGTVSFFDKGREYESFTATFAHGVAQDGHVIVRWGDGWRYEGGMAAGRFSGHGELSSADGDRLEGEFADGKLSGPAAVAAPPIVPVSLDRR